MYVIKSDRWYVANMDPQRVMWTARDDDAFMFDSFDEATGFIDNVTPAEAKTMIVVSFFENPEWLKNQGFMYVMENARFNGKLIKDITDLESAMVNTKDPVILVVMNYWMMKHYFDHCEAR